MEAKGVGMGTKDMNAESMPGSLHTKLVSWELEFTSDGERGEIVVV